MHTHTCAAAAAAAETAAEAGVEVHTTRETGETVSSTQTQLLLSQQQQLPAETPGFKA